MWPSICDFVWRKDFLWVVSSPAYLSFIEVQPWEKDLLRTFTNPVPCLGCAIVDAMSVALPSSFFY